MTFNQEQALKDYAHFMRRVQVGAYIELELDGSFPPDDGTPESTTLESTTLESIFNLEELAAKDDLVFCFHCESGTWTLEPMSDETREARARAAQAHNEGQEPVPLMGLACETASAT
jgi:hypothetical protein